MNSDGHRVGGAAGLVCHRVRQNVNKQVFMRAR